MTTKRKAKPPPRPAETDDPVPADIDEFRIALARKILTMLGMYRRCREPVCRRARRCAGATLRCQRDDPAPPYTAEQEATMRADLSRMLARWPSEPA